VYDEKGARQGRWLLALSRFLPVSLIRRIIVRQTSGQPPDNSDWIAFHDAYYREQIERVSKQMFLSFMELGLETRRSFVFEPGDVATWPGRMLLLTSEDDDFSYPRLPVLQERYPQAETHVFEAGSHHTYLFFPEAYTKVLEGFLARN